MQVQRTNPSALENGRLSQDDCHVLMVKRPQAVDGTRQPITSN